MTEFVDVVIVGAGISGISAAWHLQDRCPDKSYMILERRDNLGGTWDLFKYPGLRSDSDMYTLGFRFKPWASDQAIVDGPSILNYLKEAAAENGIDKHMRFGHKVVAANWSDADNRWELTVDRGGEQTQINCGFLLACSGYYNYDEGYSPEFAGRDDFGGTIVHPQHWPEDLDYQGKKVVVIGSGATAVTLIPALIDSGAGHVTMLQRSPDLHRTAARQGPVRRADEQDASDRRPPTPLLGGRPSPAAPSITSSPGSSRISSPRRCAQWPSACCRRAMTSTSTSARPTSRGTSGCVLAPRGDLFKAIRKGTADVVTDTIERFTETGIKLASGEELEADIIVTATGLNMQLFGGPRSSVTASRCR